MSERLVTPRLAEPPGRGALAADVAYLAGGAAMFGSAFLYWVSRGAGSGLRGHALVDAVVALHGQVAALSTGRLTIFWYLVPALGTASWIACGLGGSRSRAARVVAVAALVTALLTDAAFVKLVGTARLGWGPKVAVAGAILLTLGAWMPRGRGAAGPG